MLDGGFFMSFFSGLQKYVAALFLVMIYASASFAATNGLDLFPFLTADPKDDSSNNISIEINNDCFAGYFTNSTKVNTTPEYRDMPVGSVSECLEEAASIALRKDGTTIIWSLVPVLTTYSLNPIDDIKNIQVLLQYKF